MKNKKPKPRVMWAWPSHLADRAGPIWASREKMISSTQKPVRVAVILLDDIEAIVERAAKVLFKVNRMGDWEALHETGKLMWRHSARAALTAAGIPCKQKARK
jgi:hypothetical protein